MLKTFKFHAAVAWVKHSNNFSSYAFYGSSLFNRAMIFNRMHASCSGATFQFSYSSAIYLVNLRLLSTNDLKVKLVNTQPAKVDKQLTKSK